jgi:hypothetical protein
MTTCGATCNQHGIKYQHQATIRMRSSAISCSTRSSRRSCDSGTKQKHQLNIVTRTMGDSWADPRKWQAGRNFDNRGVHVWPSNWTRLSQQNWSVQFANPTALAVARASAAPIMSISCTTARTPILSCMHIGFECLHVFAASCIQQLQQAAAPTRQDRYAAHNRASDFRQPGNS